MAGRKPLERLPETVAEEFRELAKRRLERCGVPRNRVLRSFPGLGIRSRRWLDGALAPDTPLPLDTALEIMDRLDRLNVRLPERMFRQFYAKRLPPVAIIFPGHGEKFAELLAQEVCQISGVSEQSRNRIKKAFARVFREYERLNETPFGKDILTFITSQIGGDDEQFSLVMGQLRSPKRVIGKRTIVDSIPRFVAKKFMKTFRPRRIGKTSR